MKSVNLFQSASGLNKKTLMIALLSAAAFSSKAQTSEKANLSNKEKAMAILNSLGTNDTIGASYISDAQYKQHNLRVSNNKQGFIAFREGRPAGTKVHIIRAFEDGDYVFLHVEYGHSMTSSLVGIDIFKFENGKAVEHWDNLQKEVAPVTVGDHTMTDGPVTAKDLDKTAANKKMIRKYVQEVFIDGQLNKLDKYVSGQSFTEHHPGFKNGLNGLKRSLTEAQEKGTTLEYTAIHQVLDHGDFCLVTGEAFVAGKHTALYDLFRIENGKIVEHWDTVEEIQEKATWKNDNGKF